LRLIGLMAAAGAVTAASSATAVPTPPELPTTELAADAAWTWFSDPRAVRHVGSRDRTYLAWVDSNGDVVAGAYDHQFKLVERSVLMANLPVNDHNNPSLLVRPDRRITMFWSAHNGGALYHRTSLVPENVSVWGPLRKLPVNVPGDGAYTYTNPILLPAERNRLYLFWRAGYTHPAFSTSNNLGGGWTPARPLIEVAEQRPYVKYASNRRDTIGMAFTNGHPAETHANIYYAAYRAGHLRRADGRGIKPLAHAPITPEQADLVYKARSGEDAWVHDVALDPATGHPRIVFATIPGPDDHRYWYAAWDGARWRTTQITQAGSTINDDRRHFAYTAGISLDHDDTGSVYLSRPVAGRFEIEHWRTSDLGGTWTSEQVTVSSMRDNYRPVVPRNSKGVPGGTAPIWMSGHYGYFTSFRTSASSSDVVVPSRAVPAQFDLDTATRAVRAGELTSIRARLRPRTMLLAGGNRAGREVWLQAQVPGGDLWVNRGYAAVDRDGWFELSDRPRRDTTYRLYWPGDGSWARLHSDTLTVDVRK
jgi:hypothetical protein